MRQLLVRPGVEYVYNVAAATVTLPEFTALNKGRLLHILNVDRGVVLYDPYDPLKGCTIAGNVITLTGVNITSGHSNNDQIQIVYENASSDPNHQTPTLVGGVARKFRDSFAKAGTQPDPALWDLVKPAGHIVTKGGNAAGSSYLRISLSPLLTDSEVRLTSKAVFDYPMRLAFGLSISQRVLGQEVFIGAAGDDGTASAVDYSTTPVADIAITGSTLSVTSNVATVTSTAHGLKGGDRVLIYGAADPRLNVGPVIVTVVDANSFTVPMTLANGTYSTTGTFIKTVDPFAYAYNAAGYVFDQASVTQANLNVRRNGTKYRTLQSQTVGTTTGTQTNTSPYTDAFNPGTFYELEARFEEIGFRTVPADSLSGPSGIQKLSQVPEEEIPYHIVIRAKNLRNLTVPVGRITAISKAGSTTATVTTDVAHGLTVADQVVIYGVRDQTNFPNITAQTVVASVPTATTFTIVLSPSVTASSAGGTVFRVQGSQTPPAYGASVQSIVRSGGVMTVIGSTTWTATVGEYVYLHGLDGTGAAQYEGGYKVLRVSTTTLELEAPGADFVLINTGGAVLRMTDVRIHFARVLDYTRHVVEVVGGRGNTSDTNGAVPVALAGGSSLTTVQGSGSATAANLWQAAGYGGVLVNDTVSAALTSTTTSATVTPGGLANIGVQSQSFHVVVTAVSGTNPTLDVVVQESPDNGTNWIDVYHFERITANGSYVSPQLPATWGTRYRYVQTVGGTTPSFTRAINRIMFSHRSPLIKRFFDRTIVPTTLNSASPVFNVEGCHTIFLIAYQTVAGSPVPVYQLQGSEDGSTHWYNIGSALNGAAFPAYVSVAPATGILPKFIRVTISTAGVGSTFVWLMIRAIGF